MAEADRFKPSRFGGSIWRVIAPAVAVGGILGLLARQFLVPRQAAMATTEPPAAAPPADREQNPKTAFEPADWPVAPVALIYAGVIVLLAISCLVLIVAYPRALPDVDRTLRIAPPGPRLQTDAAGDLRRFRAQEEKRLNSYYWIDRQKGIVHIPIEQAMRKLANAGIAGFPKEK